MNLPKPSPGHINCVNCNTWDVAGCEECRRCSGHCGCACRECINCTTTRLNTAGRRVLAGIPVRHHRKYFCHTCDRCKRPNRDGNTTHQCVCRNAPAKVRQAMPRIFDNLHYNTLNRPIGLEIEASYVPTTRLGIPVEDFGLTYEWVHDGSVTAGGRELVLGRLVGDQFVRCMNVLAEKFALHGFQVDDSCGFHCHLGADDFDAYSMRRLIVLYGTFEDLFYALVKKGRDGFRVVHNERKYYARRWGQSPEWYESLKALKTQQEIRRAIVSWLYAGRLSWYQRTAVPQSQAPNLPQVRAHKYEACRYFGLNLHTWFQRNTVEFRHHEGTLALDKLVYWPLFCGWFVELASHLTDKEAWAIKTQDDLLFGTWKRPHRTLAYPEAVRQWAQATLGERQVKVKHA